jgi:signal transduction histidine kinase
MIHRSQWFFHPIFIFIFSIVALAASLALYIYWYIEVSTGLRTIVEKFDLDTAQIFTPHTWVVILILSILVGIILVGIFIIFVYSQKMVQLYRMQHNFINNFTHELKTPVTSLNLYIETFLKHELSRDDQVKYLHYMMHDVDRLSENTSRILNLARIESKSYEGEFIEANLVDVVEQFYSRNAHLFHDCRISIHNPSGRSFPYSMNQSLFEMLLMNLLTNAVKYNESTVPEVTITFLPQRRKLHLCFEDNGIGIDKAHIKKIFRKFYQVGRSDNMTAKGSGIGLYLVQSIARIHKGRVVAQSEGVAHGSVFTVMLPSIEEKKAEKTHP